MPRTKSILRYPGGKTQLAKFVQHTIELNHIEHPIYCEPFCGGSGVAIELLLNGTVESIVLNDLDPAIYSIWYFILHETERFIKKIRTTPITMQEWYHQREIYSSLENISGYNFELAFAAFFLNRTNRAGIITGGPIGGYEQKSEYSLNCRYNTNSLITKIELIANKRTQIELYHMDGIPFIRDILIPMDGAHLFIFFDPPYFKQGKKLYKNGLDAIYHENLSISIQQLHDRYWITTYDDVSQIRRLYKESDGYTYQLRYSANRVRKESELFFRSPITQVESYDKVILQPI